MLKKWSYGIQTQVIFLFSLLTVILVVLTARLAYVSALQLYLGQLQEQITLQEKIATTSLDRRFLSFLSTDSSAASDHYRAWLKNQRQQLGLAGMFIFDSAGTVLAQTSGLQAAGGILLSAGALQRLHVKKSLTSTPFKTKDGNWYLWHFNRLDKKYYLGMQVPGRYLNDLEKLAVKYILLGALGLLLVLLAAWWIGRRIARPVNALVDFSKRIGRGDLQTEAPKNVFGELARLQTALVHMQQSLAEHQQEKERILAQIAHELRNPLGGIALLAGLIKESPQDTDKNVGYAARILDETEGLKKQISAYLNFSKPAEVRQQAVDTDSMFSELDALFQGRAVKQQIELKFNSNGSRFTFDRGHLKQVLSNLIENSLRATESGGRVSVSAENGQIRVTDDGTGIAPEHLARIFEPFFSASRQGIGLGLAISRKLCRENNCTLEVENNFVDGCTFTIGQKK